jgi:hypothetical protein
VSVPVIKAIAEKIKDVLDSHNQGIGDGYNGKQRRVV